MLVATPKSAKSREDLVIEVCCRVSQGVNLGIHPCWTNLLGRFTKMIHRMKTSKNKNPGSFQQAAWTGAIVARN